MKIHKLILGVVLSINTIWVSAQNVTGCPANTNCDEPLEACQDYQLTYDCPAVPEWNSLSQLFYKITIINPNTEITVSAEGFISGSYVPTNMMYILYSYGPCPINSDSIISSSSSPISSFTYTFPTPGTYYLTLSSISVKLPRVTIDFAGENTCQLIEIDQCESCIGSFAPIPGSKYVITAWTKEEGAAATKTSYTFPELYIHFTVPDSLSPNPNATLTVTKGPYIPSGAIIDGWQRIENEFSIPYNAIDIEIELSSSSGNVLYDDIRMFPFNASMKTFVYDPVNMRLAAELDERHYSTFYEYDEEGKLVRIKKETEKGTMTIQETKSNATK
jgi:hypothetical protein